MTSPFPRDDDPREEWIAFVSHGWAARGRAEAARRPENITQVRESDNVRPGEMILAAVEPEFTPPHPWANPAHDIAADVRQFMSDAYANRDDPGWPENPQRALRPPVTEGNSLMNDEPTITPAATPEHAASTEPADMPDAIRELLERRGPGGMGIVSMMDFMRHHTDTEESLAQAIAIIHYLVDVQGGTVSIPAAHFEQDPGKDDGPEIRALREEDGTIVVKLLSQAECKAFDKEDRFSPESATMNGHDDA